MCQGKRSRIAKMILKNENKMGESIYLVSRLLYVDSNQDCMALVEGKTHSSVEQKIQRQPYTSTPNWFF